MTKEIDGTAFENHKKLRGGDAEWKDWATDFRMLVETRSETLGQLLQNIQRENRREKDVYTTEAVAAEAATHGIPVEEVRKMSKVLYRWLRLLTEGEARAVVMGEEGTGDGLRVWGLLHARWNARTVGRVMRVQQEAMYPWRVKMADVAVGLVEFERRWQRMVDAERGEKVRLRYLKLAAVMAMIPEALASRAKMMWDDTEYWEMKATRSSRRNS